MSCRGKSLSFTKWEKVKKCGKGRNCNYYKPKICLMFTPGVNSSPFSLSHVTWLIWRKNLAVTQNCSVPNMFSLLWMLNTTIIRSEEVLIGLRRMFQLKKCLQRVTEWLLQYAGFKLVAPQEWVWGLALSYRAVQSQLMGLLSAQPKWIQFLSITQCCILQSGWSDMFCKCHALHAYLQQMCDRVNFVLCVWAAGSLAFTRCHGLACSTFVSFCINSQFPASTVCYGLRAFQYHVFWKGEMKLRQRRALTSCGTYWAAALGTLVCLPVLEKPLCHKHFAVMVGGAIVFTGFSSDFAAYWEQRIFWKQWERNTSCKLS